MNIKERAFWFFGILAVFLFTQEQSNKVSNLETLITTYELESNIQHSQLMDFDQQINQACRLEYEKGFEAGKTQSAIVLMNKEALYDYADGYHAALSQFDPDNSYGDSLSSYEILDLLISTLESDSNSTEIYLDMISDLIAEGAPPK